VVEDEPDIRKLNAETLIDLGYVVDTVEDGITAWEALQHNSYDLLVIDNEMPRLSGAGLLEKLHHDRKFLPVIMATGTMPPAIVTHQPWFPLVTTLLKPYTLCLFTSSTARYAQAAADKALREARSEVRNHPERYNNTLPDQPNDRPIAEKPNGREEVTNGTFTDKTPNAPNPEILYRRKVAVGNWTLWLFSLPLIGGLSMRRWAAATLIVIFWLFDWHLIASRY
jgi:CheY-like chemotaxis protein